ncbi:MAG: ATP-binding cassette domain-containing protein, partial [Chitinispirillaceae bacterium]
MTHEVLKLTNIHKKYQGRNNSVEALSDVTVSMQRGEFYALRGPSGCGKTTALLIAGGLLMPDRGDVYIDGTKLSSLPPSRRPRFRAEKIGFVFQ